MSGSSKPSIVSLSEACAHDSFHFRGQECDVTAIIRSKVALVTFDNLASIDERPQEGEWLPWLSRYAEELDYSIVGIQSHAKDWYRNAETPAHIEALQKNGFFDRFDHVLFVGASMGGFAALVYAALVPGARALAFSPQSTLNRKIAPFEKRYPWPYRKFDWDRPEYLDASQYLDGSAGGYIFYDPYETEDRLHVERMPSSKFQTVKIPFSGHKVIRTVAKCGALKLLIRQLAEEGKPDATFWQLMRKRREDRTWAKAFLFGTLKRREGPLALCAAKQLASDYGYGFARRTRKRIKTEIREMKMAEGGSSLSKKTEGA